MKEQGRGRESEEKERKKARGVNSLHSAKLGSKEGGNEGND